ncbi:STRN4 protein, partial [Nyctibius bracteatus]|nr:STRN4 protein [Nyctibius bracteatus]
DPGVLHGVLEGHGDAVWGLTFNPAGDRLASCSADGTVRIWDPWRDAGACLGAYDAHIGERGTRGAAWVVVSKRCQVCPQPSVSPLAPPDGDVSVSPPPAGDSQVNQVVSHPLQPLTITASDDRGIRFLDNRTGGGSALVSANEDTAIGGGGTGTAWGQPCHDCSLRLWHLAHRTCVQELTAHRKKHDEAVHAVAFHPARPLSASAGADALAKVFV